MALRKEKLESLRRQLVARRETLATELRQATVEFLNEDTLYTDAIDQASAETDRSFALQLKNRDRDILWGIDDAIRRIDDGSFGICERCDESIAEARMRVRPATTLCIDCQGEVESEQHRFSRNAS